MCPKLVEDIATATRPILQVVRYRPRGNAPNLAQSLEELQAGFFEMPDDQAITYLRPFQTAFLLVRGLCDELRQIDAEVSSLSEQADEARRLHQQAIVQLNAVKSYIEAANNSVARENWEDASRLLTSFVVHFS